MAKNKTQVEKTEAPAVVMSDEQIAALEAGIYDAAKTKEVVGIVESGFIPMDDFDRVLALSSTRNTGGKRSNGVVPKKYYDIYAKQGGNNGDVFAVALREAFTVKDQWGNEHADTVGLKAWAQANGFWKDIYESKNPGMQRMNVGNLARGVIRRGGSVVLNGVEYGKGDIKPVK